MAYKRKIVVPNARLSDGGLRMFESLRPDEKETVFGFFMEHWDAARSKTASPDDIPELPKLERRLSNCLEALCQSADEGIYEYWRMADRNQRNARQTREEPPVNDRFTAGQSPVNDRSTAGKPSIHPSIQASNELSIHLPIHPTRSEIQAFCREEGLSMVDTQGFWETMERQDWKSKDGRRVEDWKSLLRAWGRGSPGKTVSAQQYGQRPYTEKELLDASADLIAEARQNREVMI